MRVINVTQPSDVPSDAVDDKPTLVYWNIVGLAQSSRLTLVQASVDFVDVRIDAGTPGSPTYREPWTGAKERLRGPVCLDAPNLPYYLDGDVKICQSDAILRYLGRQHGLYCATAGMEYITDMVLDELKDYEGASVRVAYPIGADGIKEWYENDLAHSFPTWAKGVMSRVAGDYLTGDSVCIADFKLYVFLCKLRAIDEDVRPNVSLLTDDIRAYIARLEALPNIKAYLTSADYLSRPFNNPHAKWNP